MRFILSHNKPASVVSRIIFALGLALICFFISFYKLSERAVEASDFSFPLRAAARLKAGLSPYKDSSVGSQRPYPFQTPFPYPLTAVLLTYPFSYFGGSEARLIQGPPAFSTQARQELIAIKKAIPSKRMALFHEWQIKYALPESDRTDWRSPALSAALFMGISAFVLAISILLSPDFQAWKLLLFASPSFYVALAVGQWSPLLVAGAFFFPVLGLCVVKPNVALPLLLHSLETKRSKREWQLFSVIAASLLAVSFLVMPTWPLEWFHAVRSQTEKPYFSPFLTGIGPALLLLTLARIRVRGARLVFALGLLPQHAFFYDAFSLCLIPRSAKQCLFLLTVQWTGFLTVFWLHGLNGLDLAPNLPTHLNDAIPSYSVCFFYAPAVMLLWWQARQQSRLNLQS